MVAWAFVDRATAILYQAYKDTPSAGQSATLRTATGLVRALYASIATPASGTFSAVPEVIVDHGNRDSLLGAEALERFKSYDVRNGVLTLRW